MGIAPQLTDAELVTSAMTQAVLGFASEARWLRCARSHLWHLFPALHAVAALPQETLRTRLRVLRDAGA
ncbi:hypothetical protein GCM10010446_24680 [Streptomyces enissocaesilis]|uniref:Uncharacterized protein n=1 Tax=Streptomyces enissocaesilis TaxID=332589 RepID=A0ABN3X815_9ACTN